MRVRSAIFAIWGVSKSGKDWRGGLASDVGVHKEEEEVRFGEKVGTGPVGTRVV